MPRSTPKRPTWLFWNICAAALLLLVLESYYTPPGVSQARLHSLPLQGPNFTGESIPFEPAEVEFIGRAQALKRTYTIAGISSTVILIDGTLNRHAIHDPSYCFKGMGYTLLDKASLPVSGGEARLLTLKKDNEVREVAFWFTNGQTRHASLPQYILQSALHRLTFGLLGEPPLLVIVEPSTRTHLSWSRYLQYFPSLLLL